MTRKPPALQELLRAADEFAGRFQIARRWAELDSRPEFPRPEYRGLAESGLLGLRISRDLGGAGLGMADAARVLHRLAYLGGTTFAKLALQPEFCSVLAEAGSPALRARYFVPLMRGEALIGNQITEPGAGSDVGAMAARAERVDGGYRLSGTKSEAAFAVDADAAIVYARVDGAGSTELTALLVPQDQEGIKRTAISDLGERWMRRGTIIYDRVFVPLDHRIGAEGRALEHLKDELVRERALLASIYLGVARSSWEETVRYAGTRVTFGRPLADHEAIGFPLAEDSVRLRAAELYVEEVLAGLDREPVPRAGAAALAKWLAVATALPILDHAIQFHGGAGYSKALPHEQRWRDVRSGGLAHGTSEIMLRAAARELWPRAAAKEPSARGVAHGRKVKAEPRRRTSG